MPLSLSPSTVPNDACLLQTPCRDVGTSHIRRLHWGHSLLWRMPAHVGAHGRRMTENSAGTLSGSDPTCCAILRELQARTTPLRGTPAQTCASVWPRVPRRPGRHPERHSSRCQGARLQAPRKLVLLARQSPSAGGTSDPADRARASGGRGQNDFAFCWSAPDHSDADAPHKLHCLPSLRFASESRPSKWTRCCCVAWIGTTVTGTARHVFGGANL